MKYFDGAECCLEAIEAVMLGQLREDECICANCYMGYSAIYGAVLRQRKDKYQSNWLRKRIAIHNKLKKYWKLL